MNEYKPGLPLLAFAADDVWASGALWGLSGASMVPDGLARAAVSELRLALASLLTLVAALPRLSDDMRRVFISSRSPPRERAAGDADREKSPKRDVEMLLLLLSPDAKSSTELPVASLVPYWRYRVVRGHGRWQTRVAQLLLLVVKIVLWIVKAVAGSGSRRSSS